MIWLLVLVLMIFRWPILSRFLGTINMFLFDAAMWTVWAAINFAQPMKAYPAINYICGGLCIVWAIQAGRKYQKYSEIQRIENEQGKSDSGPTNGS
jgi:Na+/melibiose symporter-like transporter